MGQEVTATEPEGPAGLWRVVQTKEGREGTFVLQKGPATGGRAGEGPAAPFCRPWGTPRGQDGPQLPCSRGKAVWPLWPTMQGGSGLCPRHRSRQHRRAVSSGPQLPAGGEADTWTFCSPAAGPCAGRAGRKGSGCLGRGKWRRVMS